MENTIAQFAENTPLKKSVFVHRTGNTIVHDIKNTTYQVDDTVLALLETLDGKAAFPQELLLQGGIAEEREQALNFLLQEEMLVVSSTDESRRFYPHKIDLETVRHCNARCVYCPQSVDRKSKAVMEWEVFETVLSRLDGFQPTWVALNHYGEPLLDPYFKERVAELTRRQFLLYFISNATLLTEDIIDCLAGARLYGMALNFPALECKQWCSMMQLPESSFIRARQAIETTIARLGERVDIMIVVNSVSPDQEDRVHAIQEHFSKFGKVIIDQRKSCSRAGLVENAHVSSVWRADERFAGCDRIVDHVHVSWQGQCFLCCEDYHQQHIFGELLRDDLMTIMTGEPASQWRAELYGLVPMRQETICRSCATLRRRGTDLHSNRKYPV